MSIVKAIVFLLFSTHFLLADDVLLFSDKEIEFIKKNPIVKLASGESFEPFIFKDAHGKIRGIDREIADIIEEKTGLSIEFELGNWEDIQQRAKNREFDGLSSLIKTEEREDFYHFTSSYLNYTPVVILNRSNPKNISSPKDLINKKVAIQKGNVSFEAMAKSLGEVNIIYYDTIHDMLNALVANEVDFTLLDESVFYVANKMGIHHFIKTSFPLGEKVYIYFALSNEKPLLSSIFDKALKATSPYRLFEIKNRWFKAISDNELSFTLKEKDYLYQKKQINICINPDWYPFEKIEDGTHIGMSADFIKLIESKIHLPFKLVKTQSWEESLNFIKERKCDLLPLAMKTTQREKHLNFTSAYITVPLVMVTQKDIPFSDDITHLYNKKIGILKDHAFHDILQENHHKIQLEDVNTIKEGLKKVESEELFGFIDALASISYQFQEEMSRNIKISGRFDEKWELSVGVHEDDPLLLSIMEKTVTHIKSDEKQAILNKYIAVTYEKGTDYSLVFQILGGALFILIIILFWHYRTQQEARKLNRLYQELKVKDEQIQKQLEQMETGRKFLTHILDNIPVRVFWKDKDGRYVGANRHFLDDAGLQEFSELLGKKDSQMPWKGEEADKYRADDMRIMQIGKPELQFEETQHSADKKMWVITSKVPLKDTHGTVIGVLGIYDDITERKLIEEELQAKDEMLIAQSRHAAMGEMSAMIAHQWRQPLATIGMGLNNIILDIELESLDEETLKKSAISMNKHLQYLSKTIDDFSDFFKPNKELQLVFAEQIINETISIVGKLLENHCIRLSIENTAHTRFSTHPREMVQVLINILTNAKDALVHNTEEEDRHITIQATEDESHIIFTISDTGGGISDEHMAYIFDPYFSTKNEKNGVGLGLYMCSMIIHKHLHGVLSCENVQGGACFKIILPKEKD